MTPRTLTTATLVALSTLGLAACGTSTPAAAPVTVTVAAPAAQPTTQTGAATSTTYQQVPAPETTTAPTSSEATATVARTVTASATPTSSSTSPKAARPAVQGEPGGTLRMNGQPYGRDDAGHTKSFIAAMGTPDATATRTCTVSDSALPVKLYRWGGLHITVVQATPGGEYGDSYPKGSITGWRISADAAPTFTGPKGTTIGTSLSTLQQKFTANDWDYAQVEKNTFSVFAGDTTGAAWTLGPNKTVTEMSAGLTCSGPART